VSEDALARVHAPAGIDLGHIPNQEIAVAILAELVAWRHTKPISPTQLVEPAVAIDPVCGMTVEIQGARETAVHDGVTYYFCGPGCRRRFEENAALYLEASS